MAATVPAAGSGRQARLAAACLVTVLSLAGLAACGDASNDATTGSSPTTKRVAWTLVLDYEPNAVHAGLLRAAHAGYFRAAGIDLKIVAPASTSDALTQVSRDRAEVGLADLIDVARRNERALHATAKAQAEGETSAVRVALAGAIVQRPLSGLIVNADGPITTPQQLRGKRIAVSGVPSDAAVVGAIVQQDGKPLPVKQVTLGFNGLKALKAGRVDATTAYWPADAVTLQQLGTKPRVFKLDDAGPRYPGLVAFTTEQLAREQPQKVAAFTAALAHGTRDVIADGRVGLAALAADYPELDPTTTKLQLQQYLPLFGDARTAGKIDPAALEAFAAFAAKSGLTSGALTAPELAGPAYVTGFQDPAGTTAAGKPTTTR